MKTTAIDVLTELLRYRRIPAVCVSSTGTAGPAKKWGALRCEIRLNDGRCPVNRALDAATRDRPTMKLAQLDAALLSQKERRVYCDLIGELDEKWASMVLRQWSKLSPGDLKLYRPQEAEEAAAKLRATRRWTQRCLVRSGLEAAYLLAYGVLAPEEIAAVEATEQCILTKRQQREARRAPAPKPFRVICFRWHGIELEAIIQKDLSGSHQQAVTYRVVGWDTCSHETSWRGAIRAWLAYRPKCIGAYNVFRSRRDKGLPTWTVKHAIDPHRSWTIKRNRRDLAHLIRVDRRACYQARLARPDPQAPDTLGWRVWHWDEDNGRLLSPNGTVWETAELRVPHWDRSDVVRGRAGIHAAPCGGR